MCQFWARADFDGWDALHTTRSEATLENLQEVCVVAYVYSIWMLLVLAVYKYIHKNITCTICLLLSQHFHDLEFHSEPSPVSAVTVMTLEMSFCSFCVFC